MGKRISARPYLVPPRVQLEEGYEQGQIHGLRDFLLNVHVDLTFEVARQVERSKAEAAIGEKSFYFSLQKRSKKVFADPADSLVFTDGHCMLEIIKKLRKLEGFEKAEAAAQAAAEAIGATPAAAA